MPSATPLRSLGRTDPRGFRVLSDAHLAYADGSEARLADIVARASDLSSQSEELASRADDWGTAYSLVPARANVLRGLELTADMAVLEIGCGCGPITRYLGETCGTVDSLEPMQPRATVASLRTRDLDSVQVFVGTLDDVPKTPTYDVVVVVGVLEYVGSGALSPQPYLDFLRDCHAVLRDGGTLVLAIENALGVKYLAGAAEDHTNRPFDSLEGYALWSPARTFSRQVLTGMVAEAGFSSVDVLGAFPDYKLPRAVLSDALFRTSPQLATTMPRFPSPDYVVPRLNLADEGLAWRTLVDAGVGEHFSNSFVVLASNGGGPSSLWPPERLGMLFSTSRRAAYAIRAEVCRSDDGAEFRRSLLYPSVPAPDSDRIHHVVTTREPAVVGTDMVYAMVSEPERRPQLLKQWLKLLPEAAEYAPVDLLPHNIIVAPDGTLVAIDQEWEVRGYRDRSVVVRGLFLAVESMAQLSRPASLAPWETVADAMQGLAAEAGVDLDEAAWKDFVADEVGFVTAVTTVEDEPEAARAHVAADLEAMRTQSLASVRGGERFDRQWAAAVEQLSAHGESFEHLGEQVHEMRQEVESAEQELAQEHAVRAAAERRAALAERDLEHVLRLSLYGAFVRARRWWIRRQHARGATDARRDQP